MPKMPKAPVPKCVFHLDYNDVLNSGRPDFLEAMVTFLIAVHYLGDEVYAYLLSYAPSPERRRQVLNELDNAEAIELLHGIVFTMKRHRYERRGWREVFTEKCTWKSKNKYVKDVPFDIFWGGKDEYLSRRYPVGAIHPDSRFMFVDDKSDTLVAARELMPVLHCTEFTHRWFDTDPTCYTHVSNLRELLNVIRVFAEPFLGPPFGSQPSQDAQSYRGEVVMTEEIWQHWLPRKKTQIDDKAEVREYLVTT
jgi:hypothetical protein